MTEWKAGQEVVIGSGYGDSISYSLHRIDRVLKTTIILSNGTKWDHSGHPRPRERWSTRHMEVATQEIKNKIRCQKLVRSIGRIKLSNLPLDVLEEIYKIVQDYILVNR